MRHILIAVKSDGIVDCMICSYLLAYQAGTAPALSPLDLQRKRSLERIRADQRAAAAGSAMPAALMRLTSAERRDILAGSPAGSALGQPVAASGIPGSRRGSLLATVPSEVGHSDAEVTVPVQMASTLPGNPTHAASRRHSVDLKVFKQVAKRLTAAAPAKRTLSQEEASPHVALDVREEGAVVSLQQGPSDASEETYPSEAGGDAAMALELEVLRSEELVHGIEEDQVCTAGKHLDLRWGHLESELSTLIRQLEMLMKHLR